MGKSRADYFRQYRQRKRKDKLRTGEVEPKKVGRNSTQRNRDFRARAKAILSSIPTASTSPAIPNIVVNHATLRPQSLTFDMGRSTLSASVSNIQPAEVHPHPFEVKQETSIREDVEQTEQAADNCTVRQYHNHKTNDRNRSLLKKTLRTNVESTKEHHSLNGMLASEATRDDLQNVDIPANIDDYTGHCLSSPNKPYKNANSTRKAAISLTCTRENFIDERLNESSGTSLLIVNSEAKCSEKPSAPLETVQTSSRVKRSRKQQLTSVNRADSEIIIQPASFPSEENEPTKKRGRRKRKPGRPAVYQAKAAVTMKLMRLQRLRPVEVIKIGVDEVDCLRGKDIVEITIDGNKEKGRWRYMCSGMHV